MASYQTDASQQGMQRMQQDMQMATGMQKNAIQDLQQMPDMNQMKQMHQQMLLQQQMAEQKDPSRIVDLADDLNNMMAEPAMQPIPPMNALQMQGQGEMAARMQGMHPMAMHPDMERRVRKPEGFMSKVPEILRDPLLVAVVYIVLSQPAVLNFFANYIPQLKASDGVVSTIGVIIYAVIVAAVFGALKYFLNRNA